MPIPVILGCTANNMPKEPEFRTNLLDTPGVQAVVLIRKHIPCVTKSLGASDCRS